MRRKTSEMKRLFPFLAAFCHGLIIPCTTFDLKNVKGKGQTFQGAGVGSPPRFPTGAELGMSGGIPGLSNVVSRGPQEGRERESARVRQPSVPFTVSWATATEKRGCRGLGRDPCGVRGRMLPRKALQSPSGGFIFFFPSQSPRMAA